MNLGWLVLASVGALFAFGYLRYDFIFVPLATLAAGLAAIAFDSSTTGAKRRWALVMVSLLTALVSVTLISIETDLFELVQRRQEAYAALSADTGSLGDQLVKAPLSARLILGSLYLLVFPIPVWTGFQLESAYQLFKSLNGLFMYGLIPLAALGMWRIVTKEAFRAAPLLHGILVTMGLMVAIAGTSLETRHFGVFLVPGLVLATAPDLTDRHEWQNYKRLLICFIAVMTAIHVVWAALKFL